MSDEATVHRLVLKLPNRHYIDVTHAGETLRIRLYRDSARQIKLEIDAPLSFQIRRDGARVHHTQHLTPPEAPPCRSSSGTPRLADLGSATTGPLYERARRRHGGSRSRGSSE